MRIISSDAKNLIGAIIMTSYLFILLLAFVNYSYAQVNLAKAYLVLNPAGDFVATMKVTSGFATVQNGVYKAKNVIVDLNSLTTGIDLRDNHAKNKYIDVKKFPQAVLLEASGTNGTGTGRLSFHGKENIIEGTYKDINSGRSLSAQFKIKLSSFGFTDISYKGIGVEDEVQVEVVIPIVKEKKQLKDKKKPTVKK